MDHLGGWPQKGKVEQLNAVSETYPVLRSAHWFCFSAEKYFTEPVLFK